MPVIRHCARHHSSQSSVSRGEQSPRNPLSHMKLLTFDSLTYRNGVSSGSTYNYTTDYVKVMIRAMETLKQEGRLRLKTKRQALCLEHKKWQRLTQDASIWEGRILWATPNSLDLTLI